MAIRTSTVEYAFPASESTVTNGTGRVFTTLTIYLAEPVTTWRSCSLLVYVQDNVTSAYSMTAWRIQARLGSTALDTTGDGATITSTCTNSGEQCSWMLARDVTSLFTAGWSGGGSTTMDVTLTITGSAITTNASCKLILTYDTDTTTSVYKTKTVKIPIESRNAAQTTSLTEIGTNQVPNLSTFLPEASITIRDIFFEIACNDGCNGTTDFTLSLALDSESADDTGTIEAGLNSARFFWYLWKRTDMTTNATHAFKAAVTNIAGGTFNNLGAILVVTYEYREDTSTTILNSLEIPVNLDGGLLGGSTSTDKSRGTISFTIEEPTTITLVQSGVQIFASDSGATNIIVAAGSQSSRTYAQPARMNCGGWGLIHRIDSNGAMGAGITLARGKNTFTLDVYSDSVTAGQQGGNVAAILILNYTSGKVSGTGGACGHNHTIKFFSGKTAAGATYREIAAFAPTINETDFYLNAVGVSLYAFYGTTAPRGAPLVKAELKTGEFAADGWYPILSTPVWASDTEQGVFFLTSDCTGAFKRYPTDPAAAMDIETSRKYRVESSLAETFTAWHLYYTYHTITFTVSGTISGSGGGSVSLSLLDADEKLLATGSRTGNGTYSFTWYDNVASVAVIAREDGTHVGRSDEGTAS